MTKDLPPRIFLSDTKYRDIADGNIIALMIMIPLRNMSDTKYRDIADGNPSCNMITV